MYPARTVLKLLDGTVGGFIAKHMLPPARNHGKIKSMLVVRPGGIGDFILLIPALRQLHASFPNAMIDVLCEQRNMGVAALFPHFRAVYAYDKNPLSVIKMRNRYDIAINTEQLYAFGSVIARFAAPYSVGFDTPATGVHSRQVRYGKKSFEADNFLHLVSALTGKTARFNKNSPFIIPRKTALPSALTRALKDKRKIIGFFNGASYAENQWAEEKFYELCKIMQSRGWHVALFGARKSPEGLESAAKCKNVINLGGSMDIPSTAYALSKLNAFVSVSSGIGHLAYAVGIPVLFLRVNEDHTRWTPNSRLCVSINHHPAMPCCKGCGIICCPNGKHYMNMISAKDASENLFRLMEKRLNEAAHPGKEH